MLIACLVGQKKKTLDKITLHIFDDVGVAAGEFFFVNGNKEKEMDSTGIRTRVACVRYECDTTMSNTFKKNVDAIKLT